MAKRKPADEHGVKDISAALAELEQGWEDTEEQSFGDIPDGKYAVRIDEANINHSKSSGRLQVSFQMTIAEGDHRGRKLFKHDGLDTEQGRSFMRTSLARLGYEWPVDPKALPETLQSIVGSAAQVTARTKAGSDIQNVYFDKALDADTLDIDNLDDVTIQVGSRVSVDYSGEAYEGEVKAVDTDAETADITFDDESEDTIAWDDITILSEPESEEEDEDEDEEKSIVVGCKVTVEFDGDPYSGTVVSVPRNYKGLLVEFEDGDKGNFEPEDITVTEWPEEKAEEDDTTEEASVEVEFTDDDLSTPQAKRIRSLAVAHEFDPDDYDSQVDLLVDIAEYCEISGEYDSALTLIKECEAIPTEE